MVEKPYFYPMRKLQKNSKEGESNEKSELKKFYLYLILLFVLLGIPLIMYFLK